VRPSIQPHVSIILPAFGRLQYLRRPVESVYRQTLRDSDLIIADDGSDEETRAYLRSFAGDSRITLVWLAHTGIPAIVRNAALREPRDRYVAFLDSDDLCAPDKLARHVETLRSRPTCSWCCTAISHIDGSGQPLAEQPFGPWIPADSAIFELEPNASLEPIQKVTGLLHGGGRVAHAGSRADA
jgi:glycosyltransferase involved in cell wall biosynthesis